ELADAITFALGNRNPQLNPPRLAVGRVLEHLHLGLRDANRDVSLLRGAPHGLFRILFELGFLVRAPTGDERQEPLLLVLLHLAPQLAIAEPLVADELDIAN